MKVYVTVKDLTIEVADASGEAALRYSVGNAKLECDVSKLQETVGTAITQVFSQAFETPMPEQQQ